MPKRVDEVRLRMERFLLSGSVPASFRNESPVCWEESCGGVVGEEGEELVEVGVSS